MFIWSYFNISRIILFLITRMHARTRTCAALKRVLAGRRDMLSKGVADWAMGEAFAIGSLLEEGYHVRYTIQYSTVCGSGWLWHYTLLMLQHHIVNKALLMLRKLQCHIVNQALLTLRKLQRHNIIVNQAFNMNTHTHTHTGEDMLLKPFRRFSNFMARRLIISCHFRPSLDCFFSLITINDRCSLWLD